MYYTDVLSYTRINMLCLRIVTLIADRISQFEKIQDLMFAKHFTSTGNIVE